MHFANHLQFMATTLENIKHLLGRQGHFWTRSRSAVLTVLTTRTTPLRAVEIHRAIEDRRINLSSVYRSLRLFEALRIVARVELGEGAARYELADHYRDHHHHLVCDDCGRIEDVATCPVEAVGLTRQIRRRTGFAVRSHVLELFGLCRHCRREGNMRRPAR
ncbi:MAG: Fur family transcriptional regulator [Candidatus Methylomirabilales bacterium]